MEGLTFHYEVSKTSAAKGETKPLHAARQYRQAYKWAKRYLEQSQRKKLFLQCWQTDKSGIKTLRKEYTISKPIYSNATSAEQQSEILQAVEYAEQLADSDRAGKGGQKKPIEKQSR